MVAMESMSSKIVYLTLSLGLLESNLLCVIIYGLAIIDTGGSTSEIGSPGQTSVVPPNQWSLRSTETFPDDLGAQQRDSVPGSTIVYGYIYGEFIQCGSRVPYRMSRYFPHTFNVSSCEV